MGSYVGQLPWQGVDLCKLVFLWGEGCPSSSVSSVMRDNEDAMTQISRFAKSHEMTPLVGSHL